MDESGLVAVHTRSNVPSHTEIGILNETKKKSVQFIKKEEIVRRTWSIAQGIKQGILGAPLRGIGKA